MSCERPIPADQDPRWAALVARDPAADGAFVYSVRTTGVFCRPSCPSRAARPQNVRFHADAADAERAGFRPCLRCRPDLPSLAERRAQTVARACRSIAEAETPPDLKALAREAGAAPHHFHRLFKAATGLTPAAYGREVRAGRLREGLSQGASVTAAAYDAGFNSSGRLYAAAPGALGMAPRAWRSGGAGETIRFAVGTSTLGAVLVAATGVGVCAVLLGDGPEPLRRELRERFPAAELADAGEGFATLLARVVAMVESPAAAQDADLPLDLRGAAFQQRVWTALRAIPLGETAAYGEIAARIGAPDAARAVAAACAANPVALAVPCHRVVRSGGGLAGYRWGLERKAELLAREKAAARA